MHFYLLCLVLNYPVIIIGKKLVSNLRLTLCLLKTLLIIVQFLKMNQLCNILDFLILTSTETLSSLLKCISARIHTFATHCTPRTYQYPLQRFHCFINLQHPHLSPSSHQNIRKLDENAFRASQGILINCRTGLFLFCYIASVVRDSCERPAGY